MPSLPLPASLVLRAARPDDAEGIAALANLPVYRRGTLRLPFQSVAETRAFLEKRGSDNKLLVAELDGVIVGNAGLTPFAGARAHAGGIGMGVHDDWRGHGIGNALLAALIEVADNWLGLRRLELNVFDDNAAAIALYRKFGFEIEDKYRAYALRDGMLRDSLAMARLAPPPPLAHANK